MNFSRRAGHFTVKALGESTYRVVYTKTGKNATQFPNASPSNYFGFTREGRDQGIEASRLVAELHESKWMKT